MKFINDKEKLQKIQELAKNGDEGAKNFLFTFMEMDDEQANEYLSSIAVDNNEPVNEEWKQVVETLIQDENEAIDGYDKAIKFITNSDIDDVAKTNILAKLNHIKEEEIEHIEELKGVL